VVWVNRGGVPDDNLPGKIAAQVKDLSHLPALLGVS
jgi:2-haloacid dehalogenase